MTGPEGPDEVAFAALLASHGGAIRRISRIYGRGAANQDDLHQEICLQIWRSLPSFKGQSAVGTWVYRVALNTALSWQRGSERRRKHEAELALDPALHSTGTSARSEDSILEEFLSQLGPVDRALLVLYMEGLTHQEMAEVTGTSSGAVGVRLHRIRRLFTARYIGD